MGSNLDKTFCDLVFPAGQMLFTSKGDELRISFRFNTEAEDTLVEDCLIQKWAFDNTLLSVEDMIGKLGMSDNGVPIAKEASDWSVPDALMFGRARTKVHFDIGHQVEVTCARFLQCNYCKRSLNLYVGERLSLRSSLLFDGMNHMQS
jgi:hypothetical protein